MHAVALVPSHVWPAGHDVHTFAVTYLGQALLLMQGRVESEPSHVWPAGHATHELEAMCFVAPHSLHVGYDPVPLPGTQLPPP